MIWVGNLTMLVLNLPVIGLWVKTISVPHHLLYPAILVFCAIGTLSSSRAPSSQLGTIAASYRRGGA